MQQGPSRRSLDQRYIYFLLESPVHDHLDYSRFSGFFNMTMTYRRDSDVFVPYGSFRPSEPASVESILNRVRELPKKKLVAWVVSNCETNSRREEYVRELQKHIPVDIFGKCGPNKCPGAKVSSGGVSGECGRLLEREYMFQDVTNIRIFEYIRIFSNTNIPLYHICIIFFDTNIFAYSFVLFFLYKYIRIFIRIVFGYKYIRIFVCIENLYSSHPDMFYLAFENSKCDDYVTEKFFATAKMDIVPIVMGGSNYSVR